MQNNLAIHRSNRENDRKGPFSFSEIYRFAENQQEKLLSLAKNDIFGENLTKFSLISLGCANLV